MAWKESKAADRIGKALAAVDKVTVKDFTREMSLDGIKVTDAYRVNAVHLYIDLLNAESLLGTDSETEQKHRRVLRFLNLHQRAVEAILNGAGAVKVDFHNQRLHAVVTHPLNDEAKRIHKAVAIASLIVDLLAEVSDPNDVLPAAVVRVGIDSGLALAVNNGRRGSREPLFLGNPANLAAKFAAGATPGIFVTPNARAVAGYEEVEDPKNTPLTDAEIAGAEEAADIGITKESCLDTWEEELASHPLKEFEFTRPTPPLRDFDETFDTVGPGGSRHIDSCSIYADIDGFTAYVAKNLQDDPEAVVRALHVLRSELDSVLHSDFGGLKVRFIGDCVHGVLAEGAKVTDREASVSTAVLCAAAMRSSFDLAKEKVEGIDELGLAIGIDLGPASLTRLGVRGARNRCSIGRATFRAEREQSGCDGSQTALGEAAYAAATAGVQELFGEDRRRAGLTYDDAVEALDDAGDSTAKAVVKAAMEVAPAYIRRAEEADARPHSDRHW